MKTPELILFAVVPMVLLSGCKQQYDASKAKWESQNIENYSYTLVVPQGHPIPPLGPGVVTVADGVVISVEGLPVEQGKTIDELFERVEAVCNAVFWNPFPLINGCRVWYDAALGYPRQLGGGWGGFQVSEFVSNETAPPLIN